MVTVATFLKIEQAHLLRMRLGAGGIEAFVQDECLVQLYWLYALAIGGVRVQVAVEDGEAAHALLGEDRGIEDFEPDRRCPRCDSGSVEFERYSRRIAFLSLVFLSFPLPSPRRAWRCDDCLHVFPMRAP